MSRRAQRCFAIFSQATHSGNGFSPFACFVLLELPSLLEELNHPAAGGGSAAAATVSPKLRGQAGRTFTPAYNIMTLKRPGFQTNSGPVETPAVHPY